MGEPRGMRAFARMLVVLGLAAASEGRVAAAEDLDTKTAEALFRDGKALLEQHDYVRACPLLSASVSLDPATGALLALAICREGEGKLASAAQGYELVAARAAGEHRPDRVEVARARAANIAPRISTLTIVPPANAARLERLSMRRNRVAVEPSAWNVPVPCDGGDYLIEVAATGKQTWRLTVSLKATGDARLVAVPELEDAKLAATSGDAALAGSAPSPAPRVPTAWNSPDLATRLSAATEPVTRAGRPALRIAGLALMGAGVTALAAGAVYGLRAMSKNQDSRAGCDGNVCDPDGRRDRLAALSAAERATFAFIAGGIGAAAGGALLAIGRRAPAARAAPTSGIVGAGIGLGPGRAELLLRLSLDP